MHLSQLVYCSRPNDGVTVDDVRAIIEAARPHNASLDVTGMLVFRADFFCQVLEGDRHRVSALYSRIARDPRHRDLILIGSKDIEQRMFADWSMGYLSLVGSQRDLIREFNIGPDHSLPGIGHDEVVEMLRALSSEADRRAPVG